MLTQSNYQYVWFSDNYNDSSENIYLSGLTEGEQHEILSTNVNYGTAESYTEPIYNILTDVSWSGATGEIFGASLHPVVSNRVDIVEQGQAKLKIINAQNYFTIPLNIYFKFAINNQSSFEVPFSTTSTPELVKNLKIFIEPENESRALEFKIKFKLKRNKTATYNSGSQGATGAV